MQADVERAALKAANMAGGVKVEEGGVLRLPDGDRGFPVKLETRDLGAGEAVAVALHADHAVIAVRCRARPEQVERALANGHDEATALTERRRAGKPSRSPTRSARARPASSCHRPISARSPSCA
ncbi:MAG: hypothetical protein HS111_28935 [Kofleriaceae bacterium]|nr:hypothetical protein [Kofleriaceae bacterium]